MQVTEAKTVFAEVLAELMQAKGIDPTPQAMRQLAERSELDVVAFEARLASDDVEFPGYLDRLADELELDENERMRLAYAFSFELRWPEEEKRTICRFPGCDRPLAYPDNPRELEVCQMHRDFMDANGALEEAQLVEAVLRPWVESSEAIGFRLLTEVMSEALQKVEATIQAQQEEAERLEALL